MIKYQEKFKRKRLIIFFSVTTEIFKNKVSFYYPQNVSHFLWLYQTSEFLDCDRTLADEMEKKFNLYQNSSLIKLTLKPMRSIVSILNRLEKHNWLAGGTLLGKICFFCNIIKN